MSGQPGVAQIDKATMTPGEYGDRTSFVTATGAISGPEILFGDIEDEHVPDHPRAGRKLRRLADAQQDPGAEELAEALHQSAQKLSERPERRPQASNRRGPSLSTMAPVGNCENA